MRGFLLRALGRVAVSLLVKVVLSVALSAPIGAVLAAVVDVPRWTQAVVGVSVATLVGVVIFVLLGTAATLPDAMAERLRGFYARGDTLAAKFQSDAAWFNSPDQHVHHPYEDQYLSWRSDLRAYLGSARAEWLATFPDPAPRLEPIHYPGETPNALMVKMFRSELYQLEACIKSLA